MLDRCQFFFNRKEYHLAEKALSMAMYSIVKGYGILGENYKIKELYKQFRLMYRKLVFKNTSMKFKYKCGIFALNKQIFIKLKKWRLLGRHFLYIHIRVHFVIPYINRYLECLPFWCNRLKPVSSAVQQEILLLRCPYFHLISHYIVIKTRWQGIFMLFSKNKRMYVLFGLSMI